MDTTFGLDSRWTHLTIDTLTLDAQGIKVLMRTYGIFSEEEIVEGRYTRICAVTRCRQVQLFLDRLAHRAIVVETYTEIKLWNEL